MTGAPFDPTEKGPALMHFEPEGKDARALKDESLLDCARRAGVRIASVCGGRGICKSCIVQFTEGDVPPASESDRQFFSQNKLGKGWRRACQVRPHADARIKVPALTGATSVRHQLDGNDIWVRPDPIVQSGQLSVTPPSMNDPRADTDRLLDDMNELNLQSRSVDFALMKCLPDILRDNKWCVQTVRRLGEVIAVLPTNTPLLGLAVDVGTTNIAALLVDMSQGTTLASDGIENPQQIYGSDVISRVAEASDAPHKALEMQRLTIEALNTLVARLCEQSGHKSEQIIDVVVAGNTVMHHLVLGLPVENLAVVPFMPVANGAMDVKAKELGLVTAPGSYVHMMANIAGNVGGDHSAMLLGIRADEEKRTVLALDIGTNTEISLIHDGRMFCLSCPSGPALEGGHISSGMRAAQGAIERVQVDDKGVQLGIIGDATPLGLCGSGVIDATAAFYRDGGINSGGRITADYVHARQKEIMRELVLVESESADRADVVLTQEDIRAVQLAKGAIRVGIELLLEEAGIESDLLDRIVIAGAFGSYIDINSARTIGMVPDLPDDHFEQVGNAAGIGAKLALVSHPLRINAQTLAAENVYIEMAGSKAFSSSFITHINFPPLKDGDGPGSN
jgi:uncharacterized 2Fe-2S/4Fe-4S cluster protein (DUF4445 family)